MILRATSLAYVLSLLVPFLLVEVASAHDGEHAETTSGFQYTEELIVAGIVASVIAVGLVAWWLRRRQHQLDG